MLLFAHIFIAIGSIIWSGYTFFAPSTIKLRVSYAFIAATLVSGSYLIANLHASIMQPCLSGLAYSVIVGFETLAARRRFAGARG